MRIREPWPMARTRQRRREFAAVFAGVPRNCLGDGLEIGAGDGFLASMLAPYCRSFVTTDSYRARLAECTAATAGQGPRRLVCDARRLPFADETFDFIFSSSVLEHVCDRPAALQQMYRCLRPGGLMLHIMPSRTWKMLQVAFYYPHLLLGATDLLLERISGLAGSRLLSADKLVPPSPASPPSPSPSPSPSPPSAIGERWSDRCNWRLSLRTVLRGAIPRVHGEFSNHLTEWRGFGARPWVDEFSAAGFQVHRVLLLPLYSGYGFGLDRMRAIGERLRLSSHNAFIITKRGEAPQCPVLRWFHDAPAPALTALALS